MDYSVIIVAAGSSTRSKLSYNKVFYKIDNIPIIVLSSRHFINDDRCKKVYIVCKNEEIHQFKELFANVDKVDYVIGGNTRQESVSNALKNVESEYVLIHDGARPFVSKNIIDNIVTSLESYNAVIPVISLTDTVKIVKDNIVVKTLNRDELKCVQTPQGFKTSIIKLAHQKSDTKIFTDDSSMVEELLNEKVYTIDGDYSNIKFTIKDDFKN